MVRALRRVMPAENIVYLGDTARVPYGTRTKETVRRYAHSCAGVLNHYGVKAVVIACNTVSAVALDALGGLGVAVVGVVAPGAETAVAALRSVATKRGAGAIGLLGTRGTVASGAYEAAVSAIDPALPVVAEPAPMLVALAEEGWVTGPVPEQIASHYMSRLIDRGASVVLLGCTHYPLLAPTLAAAGARLAGWPLPIVDGAEATARRMEIRLREEGLTTERQAAGGLKLLVTDLPQSFAAAARRFLGGDLPSVVQVDVAAASASP